METLPHINLFETPVQLNLQDVSTPSEYHANRNCITNEQILAAISEAYKQTGDNRLECILTYGFVRLTECNEPTNSFFPMVWGAYGCIPIQLNEGATHTEIGSMYPIVDLVIPFIRSHFLYDTRFNPEPKKVKQVYTYFVYSASINRVKIGRTTNVDARFNQLLNGTPDHLDLLAVMTGDYEAKLHKKFQKHRVKGEWFDFTQEIKAFIDAIEHE